jgi:hypothetical protein
MCILNKLKYGDEVEGTVNASSPLYGEATGVMTGMLEVAEVAVRGGVDTTVDNVLDEVVDDRVDTDEMGVLLAPTDADVVCGEPIARTGASTVEVGAPDELVLVKDCWLLAEFKLAMVLVGKPEAMEYRVDELVLVGDVDDEVAVPADPAGAGNETPGSVVMAVLGGMSYF